MSLCRKIVHALIIPYLDKCGHKLVITWHLFFCMQCTRFYLPIRGGLISISPARGKWSFGVHQKECSVWNRACIPLHFGLLNPSPPRFASVSQGNSSIDRLLMWNVNFFPDPQPNTLLNRLQLSIGHFTVLGLVSSPLNEREAEGDLFLYKSPSFFYGNYALKILVSLRTGKKQEGLYQNKVNSSFASTCNCNWMGYIDNPQTHITSR